VAQLVAALITVHACCPSFRMCMASLIHVINWSQARVIDREPERFTRWIKEVIRIRKEGQQAMNRDEGSYQLSHAYDRFLDTASSRRVKNRKN